MTHAGVLSGPGSKLAHVQKKMLLWAKIYQLYVVLSLLFWPAFLYLLLLRTDADKW